MEQSTNIVNHSSDSASVGQPSGFDVSPLGISIDYVIAKAAEEIAHEGVGKTGRNREQGYDYRPLDEVLNVVGRIMPRYGLHLSATYKDRIAERVPTQKGGMKTIVTLTGEFTYHWNDQSRVTVTFGEAMDSSDKATNKAMAMALKYAHITRFNIPVIGSDDGDTSSPHVPTLNDTRTSDDIALKMPDIELNKWLGAISECDDIESLRGERDAAYLKADEYGDQNARLSIRQAAIARYQTMVGNK